MQGDESDHQERLEAVKDVVCARFGWKRLALPSQQFYAVDERGQVLWIKARTEESAQHSSWNWAKGGPEYPYSALVGILATATDDLLLVVRVPHAAVERLKHENQDNFRLRWNGETAQDADVEILLAADPGLQQPVSSVPEAAPTANAKPSAYVCLDCAWHRSEPDMAADGRYCVHFTPEYWEQRGYKSRWGDAAISNWPHLLILRKETDERGTEFIILAPHATRRPVRLECLGHAWGSY